VGITRGDGRSGKGGGGDRGEEEIEDTGGGLGLRVN